MAEAKRNRVHRVSGMRLVKPRAGYKSTLSLLLASANKIGGAGRPPISLKKPFLEHFVLFSTLYGFAIAQWPQSIMYW